MFAKSTSMIVYALALLACCVQLALGAAITVQEKRDVFVPPVLYPHAGTVWDKGQRHNVTWCVSLSSISPLPAADR